MIKNGLRGGMPDSLIRAFGNNLEILPLEERELKGTPYDF